MLIGWWSLGILGNLSQLPSGCEDSTFLRLFGSFWLSISIELEWICPWKGGWVRRGWDSCKRRHCLENLGKLSMFPFSVVICLPSEPIQISMLIVIWRVPRDSCTTLNRLSYILKHCLGRRGLKIWFSFCLPSTEISSELSWSDTIFYRHSEHPSSCQPKFDFTKHMTLLTSNKKPILQANWLGHELYTSSRIISMASRLPRHPVRTAILYFSVASSCLDSFS